MPYIVIDKQTEKQATKTRYKTLKSARRAVDKLDNAYGAYRYRHEKIIETDDEVDHAMRRMIHNWKRCGETGIKARWLMIEDESLTCLIRTDEMPNGFLWQFQKNVGYAPTLQDAKNIVEAAREVYPRKIF